MLPAWTLVTPPAQEPLTLAEAKAQARITHSDEDALLTSYIATARQEAEAYMSRGLFTQTWKLVLPTFYSEILLPMADPLQSITSVKYYDGAGTLQTVTPTVYAVDTTHRPGRILLASGQSWPAATARAAGAVEITYLIGWATVAAIPEQFKQGVRLYVSYLDADREGLEALAQQAKTAAFNCWRDRVSYIPPEAA